MGGGGAGRSRSEMENIIENDSKNLIICRDLSTDESEIQEVNPLKTVAPPLQPQPWNEESIQDEE